MISMTHKTATHIQKHRKMITKLHKMSSNNKKQLQRNSNGSANYKATHEAVSIWHKFMMLNKQCNQ